MSILGFLHHAGPLKLIAACKPVARFMSFLLIISVLFVVFVQRKVSRNSCFLLTVLFCLHVASASFSSCLLFFMTFHSQDSRNDIYEESHYKLRLPSFEKKTKKNPHLLSQNKPASKCDSLCTSVYLPT